MKMGIGNLLPMCCDSVSLWQAVGMNEDRCRKLYTDGLGESLLLVIKAPKNS